MVAYTNCIIIGLTILDWEKFFEACVIESFLINAIWVLKNATTKTGKYSIKTVKSFFHNSACMATVLILRSIQNGKM